MNTIAIIGLTSGILFAIFHLLTTPLATEFIKNRITEDDKPATPLVVMSCTTVLFGLANLICIFILIFTFKFSVILSAVILFALIALEQVTKRKESVTKEEAHQIDGYAWVIYIVTMAATLIFRLAPFLAFFLLPT